MISKSKFEASPKIISELFEKAGLGEALNIAPLGAGEYNSVYSADANGKAYAVKIAPVDLSCSLTYEADMMRQEIYFYGLMKNSAGIRVPEIFFSDFSETVIPAPYFIMERLSGTQIDRAGLTAEERADCDRKTAQMVAKMHSVKGEKFGYIQNGLHDNWYLALSSMVENLIKDCFRFKKRTPRGEKLLKLISANRAVLEEAESRLINFDIWPPNIFCDRVDGKPELSWIDPERCLWGDRIADFVCLDFIDMSLEKKKKTIDAYNSFSDTPVTLNKNERIRFALMLGYLGLIMETEKYARYSPLHFGWWRNVMACKILFSNCFKQLKGLAA